MKQVHLRFIEVTQQLVTSNEVLWIQWANISGWTRSSYKPTENATGETS